MELTANKVKRGLAPKIRALKLKHPELTHTAIARRVGCTGNNVSGVLRGFLGNHSPDQLQEYQANRADILDAVSHRLLESITPAKMQKGSALQLATAYGILHDKSQVLRGQATGINVTVLMDVVEAIRARLNQ